MTPYELAPWLGEHESPIQSLQRGVQAGSQISTNFLQGMREGREQSEFQMMAPLHYQQAEQQVKQQALQIATQQNMLNLQTQTRAGEAMFSGVVADIAASGGWDKPENQAKAYQAIAASPWIANSPFVKMTMDNFEKSSIANQKAVTLKNQLDIRESQLGVSKEHLALAQAKADAGGQVQQLLDSADKENILAQQAKESGDTAGAQRHLDRAAAFRNAVPSTKQRKIAIGYDDQGRVIFSDTEGNAEGQTAPTVGTQTMAQGKLLRYENVNQLLTTLQKSLSPRDVGAAGVGGEFLFDRTLSQIPGLAGMASNGRIANRAAMGVARESLMRDISDDARFSNKDREDIGKILPSTGVFESYPDAMQRLSTVKQIINDRSRNYAERLGEPIPIFAQTQDETVAEYKKKQSAIQKSVQAGTINQEEADKQIDALSNRYLDALQKFH